MIICPKCGAQNPDGMMFCGNCKIELPRMQQQMQQVAQQQQFQYPQQMIQRRSPLPIIALILVAIIVIALVAVVLTLPKGVQINNWDADGYNLVIIGDVRFTVNVTNHDGTIATKSILCAVIFDNGDTFAQSQSVTLNPGETKIVTIDVLVTNMSHLSDINGEDWANVACTLI